MEGSQEVIRNINTLDERKMRLRMPIPFFENFPKMFVFSKKNYFLGYFVMGTRKGSKTKISLWNNLRWIPI